MSKAEEKTKFLLTYKFRTYPSALLECRMENWLYILHNLYNHVIYNYISFEDLNIKGLVENSNLEIAQMSRMRGGVR